MAHRYHHSAEIHGHSSKKAHASSGHAEHGRKHPHSSSHMIAEDHSAACLLPNGVIDKTYGSYEHAMPDYHLPDLSTGVEKQMSEDRTDMKRAFKPSKY